MSLLDNFVPAPRIARHRSAESREFCAYCGQVEILPGDSFWTHEADPDFSFCSYGCAKHDLETTHGDKMPCNHCGYPIAVTPDADLCDECEAKYWDWQRRRAHNM